MLLNIARFEFRYLLRNRLLWIAAVLGFAMLFFSMNLHKWELGSEGGYFRNSAYATLRNSVMFSLMFMFVSASFVANAVIRDDETGYGPIIRSTPITKFEYVIGRFLGAYAMAAVCMLVLPLGSLLGTLMPWADPANLGPNRITDYLYAYFVIALPNLLMHSAIFFALATITRSMMATYLAVISFVCAFFSLQEAGVRPQLNAVLAIAEPFGARAVKDAVRYWTIPQRNAMLPELSGALLYNRLLWIGVSLLCLAVAYAAYRFADRGMSKRERKKLKLAQREQAPRAASSATATFIAPALPSATHGNALRVLMWLRTKFEFRQVILSPAFPVLLAFGIFNTVSLLFTHRYPEYRPEYPTTLSLIPIIEESFRLALMVVAVFYAGELVWRERDRRVHELIDAAPIPNWAYVIPKTMALALVLVSIVLCNAGAAIAVQLSLGFTDIELGKYLLWYVLPASFDMLLLAAVAILVQSLSVHKFVGWGVMVLIMFWQELNRVAHIVNHNLLNYAQTPEMPLSDLNGAAFFWKGAWTFRLYWGALAAVLLLVAHLLWRRGTEIRLKPRLVLARRRLAGAPGIVGAVALLTFAATGAYAWYNTNVLNEYRTKEESELRAVNFEKRYGKYQGLPQPSLEEATLDIALDPRERRAVTRGRYLVRNQTAQPIADLHVSVPVSEGLELTSVSVAGAQQILNDENYNYRILRLARPLQPNDTLLVTFETRRWHRGFRNASQDTTIVENGTLLTEEELIPVLGNYYPGFIQDPETRRKYGLPELPPSLKLEDPAASFQASFPNKWIKRFDITLSTVADQTPIAPGKKISDVTRNGRRTARFVTTAPMHLRFSIQSARYAEKHRNHAGVDLAVYYHPRHRWNVDRMLDAMAASLDYYQANFGPYPYDHFRIVEFPGYHGHAEAFAGTIAFAETVGFTAEYNKDDVFDYVTGITAHEFAHQWWPGQMRGAEAEGYLVFVETLAQYSAHMVMKQLHGEEQVGRFLQYELDRYLGGRTSEENEPPLARVGGQGYIAYQKGGMVMYLLTKRLGEDGVNRALRNMLARYKWKGAPYPRTLELIAALRAEAKTPEDQALITDLFERVTLYDLKVDAPTATHRADGKWDVTIPVAAKKFYVNDKGAETEAPLAEHIEIGLFTAEPGTDAFHQSDVITLERQPIHSGTQVLKLVTDKKPAFAGVDPYDYYIDRDSTDNVASVESPGAK
ncbi:MAG TPA: M1 family aminopeptidase [Thermoanaerobaculia bacterium]|jgi:ABC-type transport system involved in multi-copper enzyme maturation permease subunit